MTLKSVLENWDGKETESLANAFEEFSLKDGLSDELISLTAKSELQAGSLWLLKRYLEKGGNLNEEQLKRLVNFFQDINKWESSLPLLQSFPYLTFEEKHKEDFESFIRKNLSDQNTFVRAWALNAFYLLANNFPEYRGEAIQFINAAIENESASVKARIRNMIKTGFYSED